MDAKTFDLVELGPSAGLNLVWDRYRYRYEAGEWGREDAVLSFDGDERRPVPGELFDLEAAGSWSDRDRPLADRRHERGRRTVAPLVRLGGPGRPNASGSTGRSRRFANDPPQLVTGDYVEELPSVLAAQPRDGLTVVFQTASFGYIGDEGRARVRAVLEDAGRERPLAFISTGKPRDPEEHCWGLRLVYWPGGEREFAGHADFHGAWLQWEL